MNCCFVPSRKNPTKLWSVFGLMLLSASVSITNVVGSQPAAATPQLTAGRQALQAHVPAIVRQLSPVGQLAPATQLHIALGLPLRDRAGLEAFLRQLYTPSSPTYRHYLTPEQFAEQFGPTEQDYQAVRDFAAAQGLTVSATFPSRLVVDVTSSAENIQKAFHTTLRTYHHPTENRDFYAPDVEPSLDLGVSILHVSGLDNYSLQHPASLHVKPLNLNAPKVPNAGSGPGGTFMGTDFRNAYMPGVSAAGEGQSVGLLEFDGYYAGDIAKYVKQAGVGPVPLQNVYIDGFTGTPGSANVEVALDIEVVIAMAPQLSKIVVYQAPNPSPWVDLLSRMASDTTIKQFSSSWAGGFADRAADQVLLQMAAQGQSVFNASGDGDAYTGDIPFPSDSAYLTSVGGTTLTTDASGGYASEKVWNWGNGVGSSGGVSTFYSIPPWQVGFDTPNNFASATLRNIPDVALTADNIFIVADNGAQETVGGTSAASPLWAAVTALANEQATAGCGTSIGFLNPIIYGLGKGSAYNGAMHDITTGDNFSPGSPDRFAAVVGYDLATGWGSPKPGVLGVLAGPGSGAIPVQIQPLSGSSLISTDAQPIFVTVAGVTNATVSGTIAETGQTLTFANDGQPPDLVSNDTVYSVLYQVPVAPATLTLSIVVSAPGRGSATNVVTYSVVPAPLNDNFVDATKVPVGGAVYAVNNRYATVERGEPSHAGDTSMAGSLWWAWTPTSNTSVLIDTSGSRVDNVLAVYTGSSLSALQPAASASGAVAQLRPGYVTFNAQAGQAYHIALASRNSTTLGSLKLSILPTAQPDKTAPAIAVTGPQSGLTVSNQQVTITGTASDLGNPPTGVNKVVLTVNGCSTSATSGTGTWSGTVSLQPELNVIQATAYDEAGNASAPVTVELVYFAVTPGNDFFASAAPLVGLSGTNSVDTSNATKEAGEPAHAGNTGGKSVWWSFVPPVDGVLTLSTEGSSFDTLLALYTGDSITSIAPVASSDDAYPGAPGGFSLLNEAVHSGVIYHIALDGYGGASGAATLSYSFTPAKLVHVATSTTGSGNVQVATRNSLGGKGIQPGTSADVAAGTTVILTATPAVDNRFSSWSGGISDFSTPLVFVAQSNITVTANFVPFVFSDDFESGTLGHLSWISTGNPWLIEGTNVASGKYAARSAAIGNSQTSSLSLTTNFAASSGSFDLQVSSELNFDYLKFFIDGNLIQQWSGRAGWTTFSFPVPAGTHTLQWSYVKDPSGSAGLDAAFIDNVSLPIILPKDSTTPAHLAWVQNSDGSMSINVSGQVNQQYILQTSTDLVHWQNVSTASAAGGTIRIDPGTFSGPVLFYRVVAP